MSVVTRPSPPRAEDDPEALEALIEEARQRARRRRRGYGAAALAALTAGVLGFQFFGDGGSGARSSDGAEPGTGAQVSDGRWRTTPGLEGGTITAFAVDPRHPDRVFAATLEAGVFGSANGGPWRPLDLGPDVNRVDALAIAPGDSETIYAGTGHGVVKSTDGGVKWKPAGLPGASRFNRDGANDEEVASFLEQYSHRAVEGYVSALVVDPRDADVAYAGTWEKGAFKTENGGRSWRHIGPSEGVSALALHRQVIYAGGEERGVVKSKDGGASWQPAGLQGTPVSALALDPKHPQTIYAGSLAGGVFKTTDGGANWLRTSLARAGISGLSLDPDNADVVYAATWEKGLVRTQDGGRTWRTLDAGRSPSATTVDPRNPRTIYFGYGSNVGAPGVGKSVDGGRSWSPMNAGLTAARVTALAAGPDAVYATVLGRGVFKKAGGGWRPASKGLTSKIVQGVAADPRDPANVYVATDAGIFTSTNGGSSWRASLTLPLGGSQAGWFGELSALAVDPQNPMTVHAILMNDQMSFGGGFARLYESLALKSTNGGRTWPMVARARSVKVKAQLRNETRLRALSVAAQAAQHRSPLAIDPRDPGVLYVGGPGVAKSRDRPVSGTSRCSGSQSTRARPEPSTPEPIPACSRARMPERVGSRCTARSTRFASKRSPLIPRTIGPCTRGPTTVSFGVPTVASAGVDSLTSRAAPSERSRWIAPPACSTPARTAAGSTSSSSAAESVDLATAG
jgi:hypothetical protein